MRCFYWDFQKYYAAQVGLYGFFTIAGLVWWFIIARHGNSLKLKLSHSYSVYASLFMLIGGILKLLYTHLDIPTLVSRVGSIFQRLSDLNLFFAVLNVYTRIIFFEGRTIIWDILWIFIAVAAFAVSIPAIFLASTQYSLSDALYTGADAGSLFVFVVLFTLSLISLLKSTRDPDASSQFRVRLCAIIFGCLWSIARFAYFIWLVWGSRRNQCHWATDYIFGLIPTAITILSCEVANYSLFMEDFNYRHEKPDDESF